MKFNFNKTPSLNNIILDLEVALLNKELKSEEKEELRQKWIKVVTKHKKSLDKNLKRNHKKNLWIKSNLNKLKDVRVTLADKSTAMVIVDKEWEESKIEEEINKEIYRKLEEDSLEKLKKIIKKETNIGKKKGFLSNQDWKLVNNHSLKRTPITNN